MDDIDTLYDRERAMLPATQAAVPRDRTWRAHAAELAKVEAELAGYKRAVQEARSALQAALVLQQKEAVAKREGSPHTYAEASANVVECTAQLGSAIRAQRRFEVQNDITALRKKGAHVQYTKEDMGSTAWYGSCTSEGCRGFLDEGGLCGTCFEFQITCAPPVPTAPCPTCSTPVSCVSGCEHVWCPACRIMFHRATGEAIPKMVHKPYYLDPAVANYIDAETQRKMNERRRKLCHIYLWDYGLLSDDYAKFTAIEGLFDRLKNMMLRPVYPDPCTPADNTDLRVKFLVGTIDEMTFKAELIKRNRDRQCQLEIRYVLEDLLGMMLDYFRSLPRQFPPEESTRATWNKFIVNAMDELTAKRDTQINTRLREIALRYGVSTPAVVDTPNASWTKWWRFKTYSPRGELDTKGRDFFD